MADHCELCRVTSATRWGALFSQVGDPHLVQSWAYGEAKQAVDGWRPRRFVFEREGRPVAICQVLDKSVAGLAVATRLNRGPLFIEADPGDDVVRDVYRALRRHWRHLRGVLALAPALESCDENYRLVREVGFRERHRHGWCSARLDLRLDGEQLRRNLTAHWRNRLRVAERDPDLDLRVSQTDEDVEWIIDRHAENMTEKSFVGPAPAFVRALRRAAPDDFLVFRAHREGESIGGVAVCRFGNAAECYVGWFGREGRKVNVGNFLFWQIAVEMQRRGCRSLDLGGYLRSDKDAHFGHFKAGMRGSDYELLNEWLAF